jgi:branched-chain amino acid transport system substrate-binding protein
MGRILRKTLISVGLFCALLAYGFVYEWIVGYWGYTRLASERNEYVSENKDKTIHMAIVWASDEDPAFVDGANLAVAEINKTGGVKTINSKGETVSSNVVLHRYSDVTWQEGERAASAIADDKRISAVIGHTHSSRAIPAANTYEYSGILFFSTAATQASLTNHRFKYVFSLGPTDEQYFDPMLAYAAKHGLRRLAILYDRNSTGANFYNKLTARLDKDIRVVYHKSLSTDPNELAEALYYAIHSKPDIIAVGVRYDKDVRILINKLRAMGYGKVVFGGKPFDDPGLPAALGSRGDEVFVASMIKADAMAQISHEAADATAAQRFTDNVVSFQRLYEKQYGESPGFFAYQGYFSVYLYKAACEEAQTCVPLSVASALKFNQKDGILGVKFDEYNRRSDIRMYLKKISNGEFVDVE